MTHDNPERPDLVDLLATHREQQKAVPAPRTGRIDLAQIRSRLATADPTQVDQMVEEVDKLRFGQEAFDLGREHLAAGKLDRARHWLEVAVRHNIEAAQPLLNDVDVLLDAVDTPETMTITSGTAWGRVDSAEEHVRHTAILDDLHDAADVLRRAQRQAQSIVHAAHSSAAEILADARRRAGDASTGQSDSTHNSRRTAVPYLLTLELMNPTPRAWSSVVRFDPFRLATAPMSDAQSLLEHQSSCPEQAAMTLADLLATAPTDTQYQCLVQLATMASGSLGDSTVCSAINASLETRRAAAHRDRDSAARRIRNVLAALRNGHWPVHGDLSPANVLWRPPERACSFSIDRARLWTPTPSPRDPRSQVAQRQEREQFVPGPQFRRAIDELREQVAPAGT